ncbi:MAG: hypothetical protein ACTSYS_14010 [Promethearchaeota archaeon]
MKNESCFKRVLDDFIQFLKENDYNYKSIPMGIHYYIFKFNQETKGLLVVHVEDFIQYILLILSLAEKWNHSNRVIAEKLLVFDTCPFCNNAEYEKFRECYQGSMLTESCEICRSPKDICQDDGHGGYIAKLMPSNIAGKDLRKMVTIDFLFKYRNKKYRHMINLFARNVERLDNKYNSEKKENK